jgi:putative transposase
MKMRKTFKYRLYPSRSQAVLLTEQLAEACRLYNAALQERRDAWRINHVSISYYMQAAQLKEIRADGNCCIANYGVCQDILRRLDKAFKAFFTRIKRGQKAGFPRFKSATRFNSITFPTYGDGCRLLDSGKLRVQSIGLLKVKLHRPVEGKIKTASIKLEAGRWYICFSVECEATPLPPRSEYTGLDVGLSTFATLSDGTEIDNPRFYKGAQAKLRRAQRKVSRRKKGGKRRRKAVQLLQRIHVHIRNQRTDFHHKVARQLVNDYGLIAVEDLNIRGLARGILSKSVTDAGWSAFINKIAYKAEEAGRIFVKVDSRGTSQRCICGADVPKTIKQRWHACRACGLSLGRDHVSALEILRLGLSRQDITCPIKECVS